MNYLLGILGICLVFLTFRDVFHAVLVPGRIKRKLRFVPFYFHVTWTVWAAVCRRVRNEKRRQKLLSDYGPLAMLVLLGLWAAGVLIGFGLFQAAVTPGPWPKALLESMYSTGSRMFTIGSGEWGQGAPISKLLAVLEAGAGLAFVTIVITYLPVLYQLFSKRESHVILLDERAGAPVTAVSLVINHARRNALESLTELLADWEKWSAELLESHVSYPMLSYYRSQHGEQSWLTALTVVMDTCALRIAGAGGYDLFQAEATLAMSVSAIRSISELLRIERSSAYRQRLKESNQQILLEKLRECQLPIGDNDLWQRLSDVRKTYEPILAAMADYFVVELSDWMIDSRIEPSLKAVQH